METKIIWIPVPESNTNYYSISQLSMQSITAMIIVTTDIINHNYQYHWSQLIMQSITTDNNT